MIYASAAVKQQVSEIFQRRIKRQGKDVDVPCIRLRKGVSRTLAASRYVQLPEGNECKEQQDDCRRLSSQAIKDGAVKTSEKLQSWRNFALDLAGPEKESSPRLLFARQQSRLLINMAGGVFENGGLSLDRLSGLPVIPGSAVKGCARRLALAALEEWTSGQLQPGDADNLLVPAIEGFKEPVDLLFEIALIFGWSDLEWRGRENFRNDKEWQEKRPDFAWACGEQWQAIRNAVVQKLLERLRITLKKEHAATPWKSLPHFSGVITFLPAYPWDKDPGIDLDVITCHHGGYYSSNDPNAVATDTEEPVPVIFPAIAPGQTWSFLLNPTVRALEAHLSYARRWLALSLETFGIGAKTNAGYGWFDASASLQNEVLAKLKAEHAQQIKAEESRKSKEKSDAEAKAKAEAKAALAKALEGLTPEQQEDKKVELLTDAQFEAKVKTFFKESKKGGPTDEERNAIVRALRGPRLTFWTTFKGKATKGGLARAADAIRALNKQLFGDKMP